MVEKLILFFAFTYTAATIIQLCYWCLLFAKLIRVPSTTPISAENEQKAVSVIVCAKNEAKNIITNFDRLLAQNYRSFEFVAVNDQSTDKTQEVLLEYQKKYSYLRIINNLYIKKSAGKKQALSLGIRAARHPIVALTDADCQPKSAQWLSKMVSQINDEKSIVLGYGPYIETKGRLNAFIRYETVMTAIQYFSYALAGIPYMGVGRNIVYKKALFEKNEGFSSHQHIASGDDDLFIREVATSNNVAISLDPDTFMYSEAKPNLHAFLRQKMRHLSTSPLYKWYHQILLGLYAGTHVWHYFMLILLILSKNYIFLTITLYLFRIFTVALINAIVLNKLREQSILTSIVWLDAAMALYYVIVAPLPFVAKTITWK